MKCCLDEGLEPVCFERTDYIGGLWHFTEDVEEDQSCVMKSTVINTSKEMMCYSDFPVPREYAPCMHNTYVEKYFHLYADKFNLKKYIRFKTEFSGLAQSTRTHSTAMKGFRVAVIGAGGSGLPAIKCCLDEGLEPVCFERTDYIGGLWHFTEDVEEDQSCVMKSTVINTSKEMMCYSDFPIPREYAPCMHNTYVEKYFHLYADKFNLKKYIRFKTEVLSVKRAKDFASTGKWDIAYRAVGYSDSKLETFDAVLVCTGHHASKKMATWPGMEKFKGTVTHTHDYKHFHGYEGKRVVVVGVGNSGCDVTVELSRVAKKVFMSTRRGMWIMSRIERDGVPFDMVLSTRRNILLTQLFPQRMAHAYQKQSQDKFDHRKYGIMPAHGFFSQHPSVSDDLPNRIIEGSVTVKGDIREVNETGVIFEDGTKEEVDAIVLATGYIFGFPFVEKEVIDVKENHVDLFKYMYPPDLEKKTLAFIGCFQPLGALFPVSESQCRLATRVFKGDVTLPSRDEMWEDIRMKREMLSQRYVKSTRHTMQVDYVPYMDELAILNGHKPNLVKLFFTDPKLWWECFFGPTTPYQYRLHGPGAWKEAREMIMTQWERTYYSLSGRKCDSIMGDEKDSGILYVIVMAVVAVIVYAFFRWDV